MRIAVSLFFVFTNSRQGAYGEHCTTEERAVWIGNDDFTTNYQQASAKAFGSCEGTTDRLHTIYGNQISRDCLKCLGEATECGRDNCFFQCLTDQNSEACNTCIDENCLGDMLKCVGTETKDELPNRVTKHVPADTTTSKAPRTRRVTTSTPPLVDSLTQETETQLFPDVHGSPLSTRFNGIYLAFVAAVVALSVSLMRQRR